jgi:hypothetical protein
VVVLFIIGLPKRFCFAKDFWDKGKAGYKVIAFCRKQKARP